jgi:erythromycin esterase
VPSHSIAVALNETAVGDLAPLDDLVCGKRFVLLGESAHGVDEFSTLKARLVRWLHQRHGFEVLAFECSMVACWHIDQRFGHDAVDDLLRFAIYPVWQTCEVPALFQYVEYARQQSHPLRLAGFDLQDSEQFIGAIRRRHRMLAGNEFDERIESSLASNRLRWDAIRATGIGSSTASLLRDERMAENVSLLADQFFPGKRLVLWAHNSHIAKTSLRPPPFKSLGQWLADRYPGQTCSFGMFMGEGTAAANDRKIYEIEPPGANTLEGRLLAAPGEAVAATTVSLAWGGDETAARDWGIHPLTLVPASAFDAVVCVRTVRPPTFISSLDDYGR